MICTPSNPNTPILPSQRTSLLRGSSGVSGPVSRVILWFWFWAELYFSISSNKYVFTLLLPRLNLINIIFLVWNNPFSIWNQCHLSIPFCKLSPDYLTISHSISLDHIRISVMFLWTYSSFWKYYSSKWVDKLKILYWTEKQWSQRKKSINSELIKQCPSWLIFNIIVFRIRKYFKN